MDLDCHQDSHFGVAIEHFSSQKTYIVLKRLISWRQNHQQYVILLYTYLVTCDIKASLRFLQAIPKTKLSSWKGSYHQLRRASRSWNSWPGVWRRTRMNYKLACETTNAPWLRRKTNFKSYLVSGRTWTLRLHIICICIVLAYFWAVTPCKLIGVTHTYVRNLYETMMMMMMTYIHFVESDKDNIFILFV